MLISRQQIRDEMDRWGLHDWSIEYMVNWRRQLGQCHHQRKLLRFSELYLIHNDASIVIDTVKHEIAHALVGPGHKHDYLWKAFARKVGCIPRACKPAGIVSIPPRWYAQCSTHGVLAKWNRRPKYNLFSCLRCGEMVYAKRFIENGLVKI